jgi:hypothetical protein
VVWVVLEQLPNVVNTRWLRQGPFDLILLLHVESMPDMNPLVQ